MLLTLCGYSFYDISDKSVSNCAAAANDNDIVYCR